MRLTRFLSLLRPTNKVYGDRPNKLPLVELEARWEIPSGHIYEQGITETMSIDQNMHSLFGASKVSADVLTQEYARYYDLQTICFRAVCITGPSHAGVELHGFLAYLMKCTAGQLPYTVFGYAGKQVRDNIHSRDLARAFYACYKDPHIGEVYNIGGGRFSNCSLLEAIEISQEISGQDLTWSYSNNNRKGDHIWWISNINKFQEHYPEWQIEYNTQSILAEIFEKNQELWHSDA